MNIVTGSGRHRKVFELPCATIVKRSPEGEQKEAASVVCSLLGIKNNARKPVQASA
jgi:hypothetical protein